MPRPKKVVPPPSASVKARLAGIGGQRADGSPNVKGIAARMGRSERTVRRYLAEDRLPASADSRVSALERADARKPKWITARDEGPVARGLIGAKAGQMPAVTDVRGSLLSAYQKVNRETGEITIDTRRAAAELGVSQRSVQRWAKGEARPKLASQEALRVKVREEAVSTKRGSRMANQGASVEARVEMTVSGDKRTRTLKNIRLSANDMGRIAQAYARGGDKAASAVLTLALRRSEYVRQVSGEADPGRASTASVSIRNVQEVRFSR
jgi:predicted transcriptional regulator